VGTDDSGGVGANSFLEFTPATSGTYYVDIGEVDNNNTGDYSLFVTSIVSPRNPLTSAIDNFTGVVVGETIIGGRGADIVTIGAGSDAIGEQGNDIIIGNALFNVISGGLGDDTLLAGDGGDEMFGDAGNDIIFGGIDGADLFGGPGNDILDGQAEADSLIGGGGKDFLTGGTGGDAFRFTSVADSRKGAARDVILDFSSVDGDDIRLSQIDARNGGADNALSRMETRHFVSTMRMGWSLPSMTMAGSGSILS